MQADLNNIIVSVIIPVYNSEKYLKETIQSVINQTIQNWELIIVDDGSSDSSAEIAEKIKLQDKRIRLIQKQNTGVSDSRNVGISNAKGKYISFLDSDDIWMPNNLKYKINLLESTYSDGVYSFCEIINEHSEKTGIVKKGNEQVTLNDILLWKANYITIPSGLVFKTETIISSGGFNSQLSNNADQELLMRLLANNSKIILYESVTWFYRLHSSNMSSNIGVMEKDTLLTYSIASKKKYFKNYFFKTKCFAKMYLVLSGSWWKNGKSKKNGLIYLAKAFITNPFYTSFLLLEKKLK